RLVATQPTQVIGGLRAYPQSSQNPLTLSFAMRGFRGELRPWTIGRRFVLHQVDLAGRIEAAPPSAGPLRGAFSFLHDQISPRLLATWALIHASISASIQPTARPPTDTGRGKLGS